MSAKWFRFGVGSAAVLFTLLLPSCGHDQQLVLITVQPDTDTFGSPTTPVSADAGLSVQLKALGTYIHPQVTKDITSQVTWDSNTVGLATVSSTGLVVVTGAECGNGLVSATVTTNKSPGNLSSSGALITGFMTATVVCFTGTGPAVTINFAGTGKGAVSSSPSGLGCSATCTGTFPFGTSFTLTAIPNPPSVFGGWAGCDVVSGTACTINNIQSSKILAVTFN